MKLTLSYLRSLIFCLALMLLSGGIGWYLGYHQTQFSLNKKTFVSTNISDKNFLNGKQTVDLSLFWQIWDRLEKDFWFQENIDEQKMVYGAISGMTAALDDPYTAFFPPQDNKLAKENLDGAFGGVGIQLGYKKLNGINQLAVIAPLAGSPAEKAGVKAGEYIVKIVDELNDVNRDTGGISLPEAVELIRGKKGTLVKLSLYTENMTEPKVVELRRDTIVVPSVEIKFGLLKNGQWQEDENSQLAWLKLSRFGGLTDGQWDKAVAVIDAKPGIKGLILDLRNNPGGYLDGAVNLAGEFLDQGKVVVKQERRGQLDQEYKVARIGRLLKIPMVVLINGGSASSSEILAGALRDHNRAKLVGEKSFGKGTIQEAEDLANNAGLHITIARWLTPNGFWVHEKGLQPDIEVKLDENNLEIDNQLAEAAKILLEN